MMRWTPVGKRRGDAETRGRGEFGVAVSPRLRVPASWSAALWLFVLAITGCREELHTVYGQRSGPGATQSVNGTAVFAEMFEAAGHRVSSWGSLSPRLDEADCIVWFPDDFQPPSRDVVNWFEQWLQARPRRTLIYVGRDFDAAPWYWRKIEAAAGRQATIARLRARAETAYRLARPEKQTAECRWFKVRYGEPGGAVRNVTGEREWLHNIDPSKLEIESNSVVSSNLPEGEMLYMFGRFIKLKSSVPRLNALLESERGLILGRLAIGRGQIFLVSNGSFLLNAALVNHEHRKLAGKLVDAVGPSGRDVVFLESGRLTVDHPAGPGPAVMPSATWNDAERPLRPIDAGKDPAIRPRDPAPELRTGWEMFLVWPTNWILPHFVLAGILFCLWKLPIFGLPRPEDPPGAADFGRHVAAVAALLERTADRRFAFSRAALPADRKER